MSTDTLDNDDLCFRMRVKSRLEYERIAAQLAGPPRRLIRELPVGPAVVREAETIQVCRHCSQRLGEQHLLTCASSFQRHN